MCNCIGLSLNVNDNNAGLGLKFEMSCNNCDYKFNFMNSSVHQNANQDYYSINIRFLYTMRSIRKGAEAGRLFFGVTSDENKIL